ncbi:hypothetical protein EJB05_46077, partial [Eragrostis curvula]
MKTARQSSSQWRDLQPELLDLILERLTSLADRVRLRAVCRPWRRGTRLESLPQPFPWSTLLDGAFLDIPGGEIHRVPLPDDANCFHGSVGNWLFVQHRGGDRLSLMNPLISKHVLPLPDLSTILGHREVMPRYADTYPLALKLVHLSSQLDNKISPDSSYESTVSICRAPATATAFRDPNGERLLDVAFHDGKLYAISARKLFVLHIDDCSDEGNKPPRVSSMEPVMNYSDDPDTKFRSFSNKRIQMCRVRTGVILLHPVADCCTAEETRTFSFEIFEADVNASRWRRVDTLEGQALFAGTYSSKFLPASGCGAREDCIYFLCDYDQRHSDADPFRDCGVFNMKTEVITPLLPDTMVVRRRGCMGRPAWCEHSYTNGIYGPRFLAGQAYP